MIGQRARANVVVLFASLIAANVAAWVWAWSAFADRPALLGTALLAWMFGLRHAVDADHIAAIDNVVRKLVNEGRRPLGVGLFFSLGHSTVVVIACAMIAATASSVSVQALREAGGAIGTLVSSGFLVVIAAINLVILRGVWRRIRTVRRGGGAPDASLDDLLSGRGLLARLLRPAMRLVRRSAHMYPLGLLFGLGFDTATEIGLLAVAATEAAQGLSAWHVMVFPALFTTGMALIDTADSVLMVGVYGWASVHPLRKLWYNLTVTAASIAVALLIGGLEALGLLANRLNLEGGVWSVIARLNGEQTALVVAVILIFGLCWAGSATLMRRQRVAVAVPVNDQGGASRFAIARHGRM